MHWALKVITGFLVAYAVYLLSAIPAAYFEFKERPREPMDWCHRHGFFRKKHALPFFTTTVCPQCYLETWKKAEKGELGK